MNDRGQVGVVVIGDARSNAVDECSLEDVELLAASEKTGLPRAREFCESGDRPLGGVVATGVDRKTDPVDERSRPLMADLARYIARPRMDGKAGKLSGVVFDQLYSLLDPVIVIGSRSLLPAVSCADPPRDAGLKPKKNWFSWCSRAISNI